LSLKFATIFYNHFKQLTFMPIPAYSGSFGKPQLQHLLRRTLFGASKADLAAFSGQSLSQVVTTLLADLPAAAPPLVDYTDAPATGTTGSRNWSYPGIPVGETWVNNKQTDNRVNNVNRERSTRRWWTLLMLRQDRNIREKMVLFWHNHIPTVIGGLITEGHHFYGYNKLLRQYALGNFKDLMREMTINPAMLIYLDGEDNRNTAPNENYARELQELFCVGKDLTPSYTQDDVVAAAKILTGFQRSDSYLGTTDPQNQYNDYTHKFTLSRHDTTNKTFSSFYGGTIINGSTDPTGMTEVNALIDMIFAHPEVARYVVRKLYRFFVYYKIDATIESDVIVPLANTFRNNNYNIKPVLDELLNSQHFFDSLKSTGAIIRNPMDYCLGLARTMNFVIDAGSISADYGAVHFFDSHFSNLQMRPGSPPNVAGWAAYYQTPNYHELWINAETLRRRKEYIDRLITVGINTGNPRQRVDVIAFTRTLASPDSPNLLIAEAAELLLVLPPDAAVTAQLKSILLQGQTADYYWTDAWNTYISAPTNTTNINIVQGRLRTLYIAMLNMAECHLM
jgi:uncharacterized protein (DUF1800 family)